MPQVSGNFAAYPVKVTLDGSGNGSVAFQAVGANLRISNLSVRVATQTAQAVATVYKNQIGSDYRVSGTNSGSSGDNVSIPTDLFDGERVIVVWTGGDPGAEATATFSGKQIPFDQVGHGEGGANWVSPIAAGDGSLIYPAIKSPNYSAGNTGWSLDRSGNADLNNVSVRGELIVDGTGTERIRIYNSVGQALISLSPDVPGGNFDPGQINAGDLSNQIAFLNLESPTIPFTNDSARLIMYGQGAGNAAKIDARSSNFDSLFELNVTGSVRVSNTLYLDGIDGVKRWVNGTSSVVNSATIGGAGIETVTLTLPSYTYLANHAYIVEYSSLFLVTAGPNRPVWNVRKTNNVGQMLRTANIPAISAINHTAEFSAKFNVGSADVTASLVITLQSNSGTWSVTQLGSAGNPASADVYCIGAASNQPNAVVLV